MSSTHSTHPDSMIEGIHEFTGGEGVVLSAEAWELIQSVIPEDVKATLRDHNIEVLPITTEVPEPCPECGSHYEGVCFCDA